MKVSPVFWRSFRRPFPPRAWLPVVACLALAMPLFASADASGATAGGPSPAARQAIPLIDGGYLYDQLYTMATSFSYRISGADGPPQDPTSPFNLPPTVNGWQELFAFWKKTLTSGEVNGPLAGSATVTDHYFRRPGGYQFDSDDAEVTIPGGSCPGERVLVGAHPDETPVPSRIASEINSGSTSGVNGFDAARRDITDSNLGNEGAYDGVSGVALTMAEYQALLRWYEVTGTYPERTLKVTLLDASRGTTADGLFSRTGSEYYADNLIPQGPQGQYVLFANMDSLGLDYPAYHLGTQFYWNNITGGGVGPWFTFIEATPAAPNSAYPDTGPGSPGAEITANSAQIKQFRADLQSAVSAGFAQQGAKYDFSVPLENPHRFNQTGQAPDPYPGLEVKPAYSPADQAAFSPVRDDTTATEDQQAFFDKGIPGFTASGVKNSNSDENPYAASVSATIKATPIIGYAGSQTTFQIGDNTPVAGMTATAAPVAPGATNVKVADVSNLAAGQPVFVDTGANIEYDAIASVGTAGATGTGVTLADPLRFAHATGVTFNVNEGQPVGYTGDTIEHLNYFASGAPHGPAGPGQPSVELERALELPAQWTSLLLAGNHYLGATAHPSSPVAYFETTPVKPGSALTVTFNAGFSRDAQGSTRGLKYYWDFGDGTHAAGETVTHTYRSPIYADVKLAVGQGNRWGLYRQAVAVGKPSGPAPATNPCGTFTPAESASLISTAQGVVGS
ncbi:MAG: PKD domain-containing protein [Streptosporangiaceae bacterium]|nr:PKD domain-containing protein [Streptosporangiaceae bacterium]